MSWCDPDMAIRRVSGSINSMSHGERRSDVAVPPGPRVPVPAIVAAAPWVRSIDETRCPARSATNRASSLIASPMGATSGEPVCPSAIQRSFDRSTLGCMLDHGGDRFDVELSRFDSD
jgi:hypothetical protein